MQVNQTTCYVLNDDYSHLFALRCSYLSPPYSIHVCDISMIRAASMTTAWTEAVEVADEVYGGCIYGDGVRTTDKLRWAWWSLTGWSKQGRLAELPDTQSVGFSNGDRVQRYASRVCLVLVRSN